MRASQLIEAIERTAPPKFAAAWDKCGVQVASPRQDVVHLAVTLDPTVQAVAAAQARGADFILAHHPLSLSPGLPDKLDNYHAVLKRLLRDDCWLYAAHTSLDCQPEGPVGWLARYFGLSGVRVLEPTARQSLVCARLVPLGEQKAKLFGGLAGKVQAAGLKLEPDGSLLITRPEAEWESLLAQLDEHAGGRGGFELSERKTFERELGFGLIGQLPEPLDFKEFCARLTQAASLRAFRLAGSPPETVSRLAYCPGSGASLSGLAAAKGADVFVTGDVKYHEALEAGLGRAVLDVGHFCLEEKMMQEFSGLLEAELAGFGVKVSFIGGREPFVFHCLAQ